MFLFTQKEPKLRTSRMWRCADWQTGILHGATSQRIVTSILTAARTWNSNLMAHINHERFLARYSHFIVPFVTLFSICDPAQTVSVTLLTRWSRFSSWEKQQLFSFFRRFQAGSEFNYWVVVLFFRGGVKTAGACRLITRQFIQCWSQCIELRPLFQCALRPQCLIRCTQIIIYFPITCFAGLLVKWMTEMN
jgi:hypothetical protein